MVLSSNKRHGGLFVGACMRFCDRIILLALIALWLGCDRPDYVRQGIDTFQFSGRTMGTTYGIKGWFQESLGTEVQNQATLQQQVDRLLAKINAQMSTYLPDSELSRFNSAPPGQWFLVSPETAFVVTEAIKYHKLTSGALDVTIGPLLRLWGFGPQTGERPPPSYPPDQEHLHVVLQYVGCDHLKVRADPPALQKDIEGVEIDLSSLAKGYAVDQIVALLRHQGVAGVMVEIGGEVRAVGHRPDGTAWRIGIENPMPYGRKISHVVRLRDNALATSGDYRNFQQSQGETFSHIINPRTGQSLPTQGASVTVCGTSCLEADALATALLLMGAERGVLWCEQNSVAALFLTLKAGKVVEQYSPLFLRYTR